MDQALNDINDAQRRAIEHGNGHLLVVAGPGTGKTHMLTYRILQFISKLQADEKILAITFTNKAAREMQERLTARMSAVARFVIVGTFHSFCLSILRQYFKQTNLPENFRVAAPEEIEELLKTQWGISVKELKAVTEEISQWKSFGRVQKPVRLKEYNDALRAKGLVDFDDLINETLILLKNNEKVAALIRRTYRFVCVDEYQDTNAIQNAFLKELVDDGVVLTAIGDPNQAIYAFRGSDVRFFHQFDRDFPGATVMMLRENYRSTENLLTASGQVIGAGREAGLALSAIASIHEEGRLVVYEAPTDKAEAEYVVHQIENLVGGTSMFSRDSGRVKGSGAGQCSFGDIAVLYRLNAQKNFLRQAFERSGIPFQVSGDQPLGLSIEAANAIRQSFPSPHQEAAVDALERFGKSVEGQLWLERDKDLAANWEALIRLARGSGSLAEFFDQTALEQPEDHFEFHVEKVSLMTLHASKGLEFPVVFIIGCEEHLLPLDFIGMTSDAQEERRLFYVGMTRAKEHLYLTRSRRRQLFGQTLNNPASRFLSDIQEDLKAYDQMQLKSRRENKKEDDQQLTLF